VQFAALTMATVVWRFNVWYPEHIGGKVKTGWSTLVEKHCSSGADPGGAIAPGKTYKLASFMHGIYSP